jgi:CRP-like cAMP-binding protein
MHTAYRISSHKTKTFVELSGIRGTIHTATMGLIERGGPMTGQAVPEKAELFTVLPYFKNLDLEELQSIIRFAVQRTYEPGQIVFLEGEPASGLYVVQDGWLKVSKISLDGREQILQFLGSGEVFNAVGVFTGAPNPATVTALEISKVWLLPRREMLALLDTHPALARTIIQDLAGRVMHLITLVEDLSLRKVESRFARLLLGETPGRVIQRKRWATQTEIAARLGTVPDVVSRTFRKMIDSNILKVTRSEITILDRARLEEIAAAADFPAAQSEK